MPFGLAVANADASEIRLNPADAAIFRVPADANLAAEGVYSAVRVVRDGRQLPVEQYPLRRAIQEDRLAAGGAAAPGGRRVGSSIHAAPIKDKDGKVTGASGPWWTSRRRRSCSENWTCGGGRRRRRRCRKTRFLAAVSHDIRTPANAISLLAELIRRTASNPAGRGGAELARGDAVQRLSLVNLLGDVDVARFDSGRIEVQECEFSWASCWPKSTAGCSRWQEKGLAARYCPPPEPLRVRGTA